MNLKFENKEFKLVPRTRKVVDLTKRLDAKNLNDLIFCALNEGNIEVLAELIKAFAEDEDGKQVFTDIDKAYDFIDEWKKETNKSYTDLYAEIAEVINEMGFFKKKMTEKELKAQLESPVPMINIEEIAAKSAQKIMDQMAEEEFKGYTG